MTAALAFRKETSRATAWSRDEVIARYRHLRVISKQHNSRVLDFLGRDAVLHHARRVGLAKGKTLLFDDMDELNYVFDLAIHTAPPGRSRAIDRYARASNCASGTDEALVLEATRRARFCIVAITRRHEAAGVIVRDLFRREEYWLMDEGMEITMPDGFVIATRIYTPETFSMAAGVLVPCDPEFLARVLLEVPQLGRMSLAQACDDRRFAEAIYRIALAEGLLEGVAYRDPGSELDEEA
jgi:hypothetical protein